MFIFLFTCQQNEVYKYSSSLPHQKLQHSLKEHPGLSLFCNHIRCLNLLQSSDSQHVDISFFIPSACHHTQNLLTTHQMFFDNGLETIHKSKQIFWSLWIVPTFIAVLQVNFRITPVLLRLNVRGKVAFTMC